MGNPLIQYNSDAHRVDFQRHFNNFHVSRIETTAQNMAASGVIETLDFFGRDNVSARKNWLGGTELRQLERWYEYARDGSSFKLWRDRDLGAYLDFEGTLKTNDSTDGTFTRTVGTGNNCGYIDPISGLLKFSTVANIPRYPAGKYGQGILVEGARTNIISYQSLHHADWTKTNMTTTDNTTETLDPAGGNTASKCVATADNGNAKKDTSVAIGTDDGVFSFYVKCPSATVGGYIRIESSGAAGVLVTQAFTATAFEWIRVQVYYENATPGDDWLVSFLINTDTEILYVYCPQLEVGADTLFASQPIITSGATNTRNAESLSFPISGVMDKDTGTIGFWIRPEWVYNKHLNACLFWSQDTGDAGRHLSLYVLAAGTWEYRIYDGTGAVGKELAPSASALSQNTWSHVVITYDVTISNGLKIYHNGALLATSSNDPFNSVELGTSFSTGGTSPSFCAFDDVFIRKDVLSASEITDIYDRGQALGKRRNYFSAMRLTNPAFNPIQRIGGPRWDVELEMMEELT